MRISRRWMCVAAIALAGCGVDAQQRADGMPTSASEYARLAELELGVPPTIGCGEGGRVPIHVDGVEVFERARVALGAALESAQARDKKGGT